MAGVTLKILHGADRGKVYENLGPPLTVGREEGNDIQLNDERVSRCHFKIQRDNDRLVLTDLDSTNGTKVNGIECQLKILAPWRCRCGWSQLDVGRIRRRDRRTVKARPRGESDDQPRNGVIGQFDRGRIG